MSTHNIVFELIKKLTKEEKRFFRNHAKQGQKDSNYLALFDVLEKMPAYDTAELIRKLQKKNNIINNINFYKNYLYDSVLDAMASFHAETGVKGELIKIAQRVDFLFKKGFLKEAGKLIEKGLSLSERYEMYDFWKKFIFFQYRFWNGSGAYRKILEHYSQDFLKIQHHNQMAQYTEQSFILLFALARIFSTSPQKNKEDWDIVPFLITQQKELLRLGHDSFWVKNNVYRALARAAVFYAPMNDDTDYNLLLLDLYEANPLFKEENKRGFYATLSSIISHELLNACRHATIENLMTQIREIKLLPTEPDADVIDKSRTLELTALNIVLACQKRDYTSALTYAQESIQIIKDPLFESLSHFFVFSYIEIARAFFWNRNYTDALTYVNLALSQKTRLNYFELTFLNLLGVAVHYQLKNYVLLESLLVNTLLSLNQYFDALSFEVKLVKTIQQILKKQKGKKISTSFPLITNKTPGWADRKDFWYWAQETLK